MHVTRRTFLATAGLAVASSIEPLARAQETSSRPLRLIVGYAAGGTTDLLARMAAAGLGNRLGRTVIVENHPGANGAIAIRLVLQAPADGDTLLVSSSGTITLDPYIHVPQQLDPLATLLPVAMTARYPVVMVAAPSAPFDTAAAMLRDARARPDTISYASSGIGSLNHLAGELFRMRANAPITHVPYKGDIASLADLVGGRIGFAMYPLPVALPLLRSGKLKALAIMDAQRSPLLPAVSTLGEQGLIGYDSGSWVGIFARVGTDPAIVLRLNRATNALFSSPPLPAQLAADGMVHDDLTPATFAARLASESRRWRDTAREAHVTLAD